MTEIQRFVYYNAQINEQQKLLKSVSTTELSRKRYIDENINNFIAQKEKPDNQLKQVDLIKNHSVFIYIIQINTLLQNETSARSSFTLLGLKQNFENKQRTSGSRFSKYENNSRAQVLSQCNSKKHSALGSPEHEGAMSSKLSPKLFAQENKVEWRVSKSTQHKDANLQGRRVSRTGADAACSSFNEKYINTRKYQAPVHDQIIRNPRRYCESKQFYC